MEGQAHLKNLGVKNFKFCVSFLKKSHYLVCMMTATFQQERSLQMRHQGF